MYCVDLAENAPFKSSGVICWSPPPSSLPDELSMDKRDSSGFFSTRRVCTARDRSNKTTGSSLIVVHWQISLAYCDCANSSWHAACYAIACNVCACACAHSCGYFLHYSWPVWETCSNSRHTCNQLSALAGSFLIAKSHSAEGLAPMVFIMLMTGRIPVCSGSYDVRAWTKKMHKQ
jgi:hypothetical protein